MIMDCFCWYEFGCLKLLCTWPLYFNDKMRMISDTLIIQRTAKYQYRIFCMCIWWCKANRHVLYVQASAQYYAEIMCSLFCRVNRQNRNRYLWRTLRQHSEPIYEMYGLRVQNNRLYLTAKVATFQYPV